MLAEAAPGGGYYYRHHSHHNKMMAKAPVDTRTAEVGDVVDVAVGAGAFTTLVKVVSDLGLVDTLKGVEAVTIFAPSDEAFAKLPAADVATGDVATFGGENVGLVKTDEGVVQVTY